MLSFGIFGLGGPDTLGHPHLISFFGLEVFNVGGWLTHCDFALGAPVDFLAVVEHRLIPARARSECDRRGLRQYLALSEVHTISTLKWTRILKYLSFLTQNGELCSADASARCPLVRCSLLELWKLFLWHPRGWHV